MLKNTVLIPEQELMLKVLELKKHDYRLVSVTALDYGQELELIYTFDKDLDVVGFRIRGSRDTPFVSISDIYFAAFLVENEIQDFYNVKFEGLVVDYKGHMLVEEEVRKLPYGQIMVKSSDKNQEEE